MAQYDLMMARAKRPNGIELEYTTTGSPSDPPLMLVMGFTAQLTAWPEQLVRGLADRGRFVITHDNRDCGLSSKLDGVEVDQIAVIEALGSGEPSAIKGKVPYSLSDMSDDAFAVLDDLGLETAHIAGASMGGMIVQAMAIEHPERVRTLTSIMSNTGEIEYGQSLPEAQAALLAPPPTDRAGVVEFASRALIWSSKRYADVEAMKERAGLAYDRAFYPEGALRQMGAILSYGSRADALRGLSVPTLVIHGVDDSLIAPSGGERTAELIPDAKLMMVADMGHDLPLPLVPTLIDAIIEHTDRA